MRYIFSLLFFISFFALSQTKALQLTHQESQKTKIIYEDKRIKIKTIDGNTLKGKLLIIDDQTIKVGEQLLTLDQIVKIKRHPLVMDVFIKVGFIYAGALTVGVGGLMALLGNADAGLTMVAIGGGMFTIGILSPNVLKGYSIADGWQISIHNHH